MQNILKKGQAEMIETIMVIVIVIILIVMGLFLYYKFSFANIEQSAEDKQEESGIAIMSSIASMPEIACKEKYNCVDITKVFAFKKILETNPQEYRTFFEGKKVTIRTLYPTPEEKICTEQEYQQEDFPKNCNVIELNKVTGNGFEESKIFGTATAIELPYKNRIILGRVEVEVKV